MEDVFVYPAKLPPSVRGCTTKTPDGEYCIYVNQNHSHEMQRKTIRHEMRHIKAGHFESAQGLPVIEQHADAVS